MDVADLPIPEGIVGRRHRMRVDEDLCNWKGCRCDRLCTTLFRCPGIVWSAERQAAAIDRDECLGCGACPPICPGGAIKREDRY